MVLKDFIAQFCLDRTRVFITTCKSREYVGFYVGTIEHLRHNPDVVAQMLNRRISTIEPREDTLYISLW